MGKNKKKRKPKSNKNEFKKPSAEDYKRGRVAIYATVGVTTAVIISLFYLFSSK